MHNILIDRSVDTGDIEEHLPDETIKNKIRDFYLRDSTVTIVLIGTETKNRKHVDWEIASSMRNGTINKKSAVIAVNLPSIHCDYYTVAYGEEEKQRFYQETSNWTSITTRAEYERRYPYMPARLIDNLLEPKARISVIPWEKMIGNLSVFKWLIDAAFRKRLKCEYDHSRPLRRANR
jgi:hypothetical protein